MENATTPTRPRRGILAAAVLIGASVGASAVPTTSVAAPSNQHKVVQHTGVAASHQMKSSNKQLKARSYQLKTLKPFQRKPKITNQGKVPATYNISSSKKS